jgi:hypothetical protein
MVLGGGVMIALLGVVLFAVNYPLGRNLTGCFIGSAVDPSGAPSGVSKALLRHCTPILMAASNYHLGVFILIVGVIVAVGGLIVPVVSRREVSVDR